MSNTPDEHLFDLSAEARSGRAEPPTRDRPRDERAARVERVLERLVARASAQATEALGAGVSGSLEGLQERIAGGLAGVRSSISGVEDRLSAAVAGVTAAVREVPPAVRTDLEHAIRDLRAELEVVRALPQRIGRALQVVREAVGEIAAAQEAVGERLSALAADVASVREETGPETLANEIAARTEGAIERRFQALIREIDTRLGAPEPPARRGLFRRAR